MKKKVNVTIVFAIVLLCIIAAVIIVGVCQPDRVETIQGEAEMTDYRVSSKVPGRVKEIRVEEGDYVREGDTLVILEAPDIMAKYGQASAALEAAQAVEDKANAGAPQQITLFGPASPDDIMQELRNVDVNSITPMEALNMIYDLHLRAKLR